MICKSCVYLRILQNSMFQHIQTSVQALFSGLEHQLDGSLQLAFMFFKHLRRTQKHSSVHVMTAAVRCLRILGSKGKSTLLRHSQCVHIRSQKQHLAALSDKSGHALAAALRFDSVLSQFFFNERSCLRKRQSDLCIFMEITTVGYQLVLHLQSSVIIAHIVPPTVLACGFLKH